MRNMRLPSPRSSATPARAPFLETNVYAVCDGLCGPTRARGSSAVGSRGTRNQENWTRTQLQLCASSRLYLHTAPSRKRETAARERKKEKERKNERNKLLVHPVPRLARSVARSSNDYLRLCMFLISARARRRRTPSIKVSETNDCACARSPRLFNSRCTRDSRPNDRFGRYKLRATFRFVVATLVKLLHSFYSSKINQRRIMLTSVANVERNITLLNLT